MVTLLRSVEYSFPEYRLFPSRSQTFAAASSGLIPFDFQSFTFYLHLRHPCFSSSHNDSPNSSSSNAHLTPLLFPSFLFGPATPSSYTSLDFLDSRCLRFSPQFGHFLIRPHIRAFISVPKPSHTPPPPLSVSYEHTFHLSWITIPRNTIIELATHFSRFTRFKLPSSDERSNWRKSSRVLVDDAHGILGGLL